MPKLVAGCQAVAEHSTNVHAVDLALYYCGYVLLALDGATGDRETSNTYPWTEGSCLRIRAQQPNDLGESVIPVVSVAKFADLGVDCSLK
jgi:hypothetical protein